MHRLGLGDFRIQRRPDAAGRCRMGRHPGWAEHKGRTSLARRLRTDILPDSGSRKGSIQQEPGMHFFAYGVLVRATWWREGGSMPTAARKRLRDPIFPARPAQ
jgi:hypothetical protein